MRSGTLGDAKIVVKLLKNIALIAPRQECTAWATCILALALRPFSQVKLTALQKIQHQRPL